jgi:hypothetical protein
VRRNTFPEFRFWARNAPPAHFVATSLVVLALIAIAGWLLIPDDSARTGVPAVAGGAESLGGDRMDPKSSDAATHQGDIGSTPVEGAAPTDDAIAGSVTTSVLSGTQAKGGCVSPPGSARGVGATEVRVVIGLTAIVGPAANTLFDLPEPAEQRSFFEAAIRGINREGGIACRPLVAEYVEANPADESQMMQLCRDIADRNVFAVLDTGSFASRPAVLTCFGQNKVPFFGAYFITESSRTQFYPYQFGFYTKEQLYKNTAFGLRDLGFFDPKNGFVKLGFIYRDCERQAINAFRTWIREAGVPDAQLVPYNVGCPATFASEADLAQAVLTFQREGVTHVTTANFVGDMFRFTGHAEQQRFRPRYGLPEEALVSISSSRTRAPNPDNMANALAITLSREGENHTPGMAPSGGSMRCNGYLKNAGLRPTWESHSIAGNACNQLWMLQGALSRATELSRTALQPGLQRTASIDFSFPQGPNEFTGRNVTTGGQFWRVVQFMRDCDCWRVIQRDFRRGF